MDIFICYPKRTPIGSFSGALSAVSAPEMAAQLIKALVSELKLKDDAVDEIILGSVLTAGMGQAPARQALIKGGLARSSQAMCINKVCSSGLQSVIVASERIRAGESRAVVAGGMESMSQAPYILPDFRAGGRLGHKSAEDSILVDGLWDPYGDQHMGNCAELCASKYELSREAQDEYALRSYDLAQKATSDGKFKEEILPLTIKGRKGETVVSEDEEPGRLKREKVSSLRPAFDSNGSVTAANASSINDGAALMLVCNEEFLKENNLTPIAQLLSTGSFGQEPEWFTTSPVGAVRNSLERAGKNISEIDLFEINEAFSAVALACQRELEIDLDKLNIHGGAVALGHPIGASGARILVTLLNALKQTNGKLGAVGICNGGGEATSVVVEMV